MSTRAKFAIALAVVALLALIATWPVESSFAARAKLIQVVQKPMDDVFDDAPTKVGTAQLAIVDDPAAFLKDKDDSGAFQVDDYYLQSKGLRPLQLRTVTYILGLVRIGLTVASLGLVGLALILIKRSHKNFEDMHDPRD